LGVTSIRKSRRRTTVSTAPWEVHLGTAKWSSALYSLAAEASSDHRFSLFGSSAAFWVTT
jgi:hypothetical protein